MEDNYIEEFPGGLLPSVYSEKKFIEFIRKYLAIAEERRFPINYSFKAGANLTVDVQSLSKDSKQITYSYLTSTPPTATVIVSPSSAEFGKKFQPGDISVNVTVFRKTYPLNNVTWGTGVSPAINESKITLEPILDGSSYNKVVKNANTLNWNDTVIATGGDYRDTVGSGGSLQAQISRTTRHFWGVVANPDDEIDLSTFQSSLGNIPSKITVNHGSSSTYMVLITTLDVGIYANGFEVGTVKSTQVLKPYLSDLTYTKSYSVFISTQTSTGTYTYTVK